MRVCTGTLVYNGRFINTVWISTEKSILLSLVWRFDEIRQFLLTIHFKSLLLSLVQLGDTQVPVLQMLERVKPVQFYHTSEASAV